MTIAPSFQLRQTDTHILLEISVPHIRVAVKEIELTLTNDGSELHWYAPPIYLLRLNFAPYQFRSMEEEEEEETCHASYLPHIENGVIRIQLEKLVPQQHWENLDLLGQWKPPPPPNQWLKGVVVEEEKESGDKEREPSPTSDGNRAPLHSGGFGFDRMFVENIFHDLTRDGLGKEMLECPWPLLSNNNENDDAENSIQLQRRQLRIKQYENRLFSVERYQQDLDVEDDAIYQSALAMSPHWRFVPPDTEEFFTASERLLISTIPYPLLDTPVAIPITAIDASRQQRLCIGLLDILFAYVYDHVTTEGDPTVESAWTIFILSTSFSWLDDWLDDDVADDVLFLVPAVIRSSIRRALIYPYLRSLEFACFIWTQVQTILSQGLRTVLRCLLQIRVILDRSELYYFGNKLYVDPYLMWLQQYTSSSYLETQIFVPMADCISQYIDRFNQMTQLKDSLELNLLEIEAEIWTAASLDGEAPGTNESHDESSSDGDSSSDQDDDESNQSALENECMIDNVGRMSTIHERETCDGEPETAIGLIAELQQLHIGKDHHSLDVSNSEITKSQSKTKRGPLIQEVD